MGDEGLELSQESSKITAILAKALRHALRDALGQETDGDNG